MGLDKLLDERGHVHSSKDVTNITFDKDSWIIALQYHPTAIYTLISRGGENDDEDIKAFIELIDKMLEGEIEPRETLTDNEKSELEQSREYLVDKLEF